MRYATVTKRSATSLPALLCALFFAIACRLTALHAAEGPVPKQVEFNRDVRPILSDNCFYCHGPDAQRRQAELRLDMRDEALASDAIVPGDPTASAVIARIFSESADEQMPPPDSHKKLSPHQKAILKRWVEQGAEYQKHWAYEQPVRPAIAIGPGRNGVDILVEQRLAEVGLKRSPEADRRTLIRRLSLDLLGLPPSPEAVATFVQDRDPDAYANLVEQLLSSPHYGERMAMQWLDVVRFADTAGYHSDNPRNVWPYRDWVINSFNNNKRFDRFTLEQVAGDLLPDADQESRVGSAFNRLLLSTEEGGAQPKDYEARMLTDRVRAIGAAWLGQTTGCAQCHDHKFDPFTARDFYSLGAFFADIKEPIIGRREEGMLVCTPEQEQQLAELDAARAKAKQEAGDEFRASQVKMADRAYKSYYDSLPKCLVSQSTTEKRVVRILPRGNWMDETGEQVKPALPHYLPQPTMPDDRELTRLDLALWLIARENPLTARTVMNRMWKQFFGSGLSRVLDDLGAQGEPPVNAPLLDWLACEFMDSGWDMKHMVRTIVSSATYRQTSTTMPELSAIDPDNRFTARQSAFRIDAELVRDNALAIAGLLSPEVGGPSVKPYQPEGYWENLNFPTREYVADKGEDQYRRGLYTWWQRSFLHPSLLAFDAPSREECTAERNRSNIPQQSLVLLNDPTYVEAARAFAVRILQEDTDGPAEQRIALAWQRALQRDPTADELQTMQELLRQQVEVYQRDPAAAQRLLNVGLASVPEAMELTELAAWTHVTRVLLNLHETITRN